MWANLDRMPVIVLLRHGLSSANTAGILAGRTPGVSLTEDGTRALEATLRLLPHTSFARLIHSPLLRCVQTAEIAQRHIEVTETRIGEEFVELDYGDWTGRSLADLVTTPDWKTVTERASAMRFPAGEAIAEAADRAVSGVRFLVGELRELERREQAAERPEPADAPGTAESAAGEKPKPAWGMIVSHGDIIKAIIAEALGMPLDDFQRLAVAPGSFTIIDWSGPFPVLTAMSVTAAGLAEAGVPGGGGLSDPE